MTRCFACGSLALLLSFAGFHCYGKNRSKSLTFPHSNCCFFYLGPHPHHGRQALREVCLFLFLNHLFLSPGTASDLVFLACGKNSNFFASNSSAFGIGTDSVVFFLTSSILHSGVSRSIFATGAFFRSVSFSWALHIFLFFDASSVHHVN